MADDTKPPTYQELEAECARLRGETAMKGRMLYEAGRQIKALDAEIGRLKRASAPRKLDPAATDAFRRPYR